MSKIISLCKHRGFIFQSSEIYGGCAGLWDLGPLGTLLFNNIKELWLRTFVLTQDNIFLIDGTVLMHPKVWQASGHVESFTDPLVECKGCHSRFRADHLASGRFVGTGKAKRKNQCPRCGKEQWTKPRQFNLMFKTFLGPVEDEAALTYLRPETAQSMFINFQNVLTTQRAKLPFGIAQVGKCFRNEITLGDYIFRSREFNIAEIEFFVKPGEDEKWFDFWVRQWEKFFLNLGLKKENLRRYQHPESSLAHYSKKTVDIEYKFPFGWQEVAGIANRTDYDLKRHSQFSGKDLSYFDQSSQRTEPSLSQKKKNKHYFPYVIEPTLGLERTMLAVLCEAYTEVKGGRTKTTKATKEVEVVLNLDKRLSPIKVMVLPLVRNKADLVKKAKEVYQLLKPYFVCQYDEVGSIGRRYRRGDEIGVPLAVTVDFETLKEDDVTLRERDTMKQERVKIKDLIKVIKEKIGD